MYHLTFGQWSAIVISIFRAAGFCVEIQFPVLITRFEKREAFRPYPRFFISSWQTAQLCCRVTSNLEEDHMTFQDLLIDCQKNVSSLVSVQCRVIHRNMDGPSNTTREPIRLLLHHRNCVTGEFVLILLHVFRDLQVLPTYDDSQLLYCMWYTIPGLSSFFTLGITNFLLTVLKCFMWMDTTSLRMILAMDPHMVEWWCF